MIHRTSGIPNFCLRPLVSTLPQELAAQISRKSLWGYTHSSPAAMDEFCRGNADIHLTTACAPYKD